MCDTPDAPPTSWGGLCLTCMRLNPRGAGCEAKDHSVYTGKPRTAVQAMYYSQPPPPFSFLKKHKLLWSVKQALGNDRQEIFTLPSSLRFSTHDVPLPLL